MKAIVVTDQAAGTARMKLVERPEPQAAINDVVVQVHASGFVPTELAWPSTWTDRRDRDRTPSIPGHELAGVVTALGYGTTGLSVGQRVFGLADWHRDGTLAEYVAIEARNLAPLPGDVDFTVGASLPISGLTAWQGLFQHGHLQAGQSVLAHGAAGAVGTMVTQLARLGGAYVIGTGRAADRQKALDFGAQEFVDLDNDALEDVGGVDLKMWLECPVEETDDRGRKTRTTEARDNRRGIPQGSPISPLLANLYMRRFVLGWKKLGLERSLGSRIVTYADDLVILCRRGKAEEAVRCHRRRHPEAVRRPDSSRRNTGVHRRADRGAARRRPGGRLRCRVRWCPTE